MAPLALPFYTPFPVSAAQHNERYSSNPNASPLVRMLVFHPRLVALRGRLWCRQEEGLGWWKSVTPVSLRSLDYLPATVWTSSHLPVPWPRTERFHHYASPTIDRLKSPKL